MLTNPIKGKVFQIDNSEGISEQNHSTEEEFLEITCDLPPSSLPSIFSLAANTSKTIEEKKEETLEEVVALCRAQMDKPLPDRYTPIAYAVKIGRHDAVKFLIDEGESVNAATPDIVVGISKYSYQMGKFIYEEVGVEHGRSPLEIAIKQQDVEMVKLLTTYSTENRATPELRYHRFQDISFVNSENLYERHWNLLYHGYRPPEESSPLLDALKLGNQEIIDLVIASYTDPKKLHAECTLAVDQKQWPAARYLAGLSKDIYEVIELCRAQSNKPLRERFSPIAVAVQLGRHDVVKFFINHGESVNLGTPDVPVWWDVGFDNTRTIKAGVQQGYTPLELAIKQQDVEMVKILMTFNPENRATPEISYRRFATVWNFGTDDYKTYDGDGNFQHYEDPSSLLLDAIKLGNQEIIDLVIKGYTTPNRLYAEYGVIQASKKPEAMRAWIEQNIFLWKGEHQEVSDSATELFMDNKQGLDRSPVDVERLLQHGWIVTRQELERALVANDPQIVQLLVDHTRIEESPFILLTQYNRADLVARLIEKGSLPSRDLLDMAIKHGSLNVVKAFVINNMPFEGALLLAAQQKQKAIVEYLLDLPIDKKEIEAARLAAYQGHAYDIMEMLEQKISVINKV